MSHQPSTSAPDPALLAVIRAWSGRSDRAVIFDFNGTLSDDEPVLLRLYQEMFREHLGWELTERDYLARLAGLSDREIVEIVVSEQGRDVELVEGLLVERRDRYCLLVEQASPILDDTVALVQRLVDEEIPLAIVTGAQRIDVEYVLERSPAGSAFPVIVTEEDVTRGKPDPEGFLLAATALGVPSTSILAFEDSTHGAEAARAAGMSCVTVVGTRSRDELAPVSDAVVDTLGPWLLDGR